MMELALGLIGWTIGIVALVKLAGSKRREREFEAELDEYVERETRLKGLDQQ